MSRLNEIKKIRYKLEKANSLELSREKIEFLCDWAEKGIVAISKTETTSCEWCEGNVSKYFDVNWYDFNGHERLDKSNFCPNCGRKLTCTE